MVLDKKPASAGFLLGAGMWVAEYADRLNRGATAHLN